MDSVLSVLAAILLACLLLIKSLASGDTMTPCDVV